MTYMRRAYQLVVSDTLSIAVSFDLACQKTGSTLDRTKYKTNTRRNEIPG